MTLRWLLDRIKQRFTLLNLLYLLLCVVYGYYFWEVISPYWFHPAWTTDDALQQVFPFHAVEHPEIFKDDLINEMVVGYLAPIHYWLCWGLTWVLGDPIAMTHWIMLIQMVFALGFMFLAVKTCAGTAAGLFSVAWLLHTRHIMQRLTGGLPRGWAAGILAAFLYFALKNNHWGVLITLLVGCLLHPPATFLAALTYGLYLLWRVAWPATRSEFKKPLIRYLVLSPIYLVVTLAVLHRPDHIGSMVDYETAGQMPEFQRPYGRFPFVPHKPIEHELRMFGFQAFIGRFYNPGPFWKHNIREIVVALLVALWIVGLVRKREVIPAQLGCLLLAILSAYLASREFAFKLYVPNRHLQFPLGVFFIAAFSIAAWRAFYRDKPGDYSDTRLRSAWGSGLALALIGALVYLGSGTGLYGAANFNYSLTKKGKAWIWTRKNTPTTALIAGHPTHIDPVQLFGERRGFATTETAHPFYPPYYNKMKRRLEVSLRAHYAETFEEFLSLVEPEGIDFFVFARKEFYPEALAEARYFAPFDKLVDELTARHYTEYMYKQLPKETDLEQYPFMTYKDDWSAIVDVKKLREFVDSRNSDLPQLAGVEAE